MKITIKNIIIVVIMAVGIGIYFFFKALNNQKGLIINSIFTLDVNQASIFYFVLSGFCIFALVMCGVAVYLQNKR